MGDDIVLAMPAAVWTVVPVLPGRTKEKIMKSLHLRASLFLLFGGGVIICQLPAVAGTQEIRCAFDMPDGRSDTSSQPPKRYGVAASPVRRSPMSRLTRWLAPTTTAHAHCDLPCGVYDPEQARIEAESCHKINEKYAANEDATFRTRAVAIKEERAELVKHHLDVLWHDYFKPEHLEKFPDLHDVCWKASKAASKVKQTTDLEAAKELLGLIDKIDEMWRASGGPEKTRLQAVAV